MTGLGFTDFDMEGRYIQADYENLSVACLLAPRAETDNAKQQTRKDDFYTLLASHLQKVRNKRREFIICGSWNIAPSAADVQDTKANSAASGSLPKNGNGWTNCLSPVMSTPFAKSVQTRTNSAGGPMATARITAGEVTSTSFHRA